MKKSTLFLTLLLCSSSIITVASPIIEYDINETRIYKPNFYAYNIAMITAALIGLGGSTYFTSYLLLDRYIDREDPFVHLGVVASVGIFAFSLKKYIQGCSSIIKNLLLRNKDVMLIISQQGLTYDNHPFIPWESVSNIQCIRYTTPYYNSLPYDYFDISIITNDGTYIVINNHLLHVEFNWLYKQLHTYSLKKIPVTLTPTELDYRHTPAILI